MTDKKKDKVAGNVLLVKASNKGWFLTISDNGVENSWAVTSIELLILKKLIDDRLDEILEESNE